ncbi:hypothetical protein HXX76_007552 [Chlamydomonas incerta]|uniref:Cyclic nucleotide-binding domain-containing protein n=1 Tax=Chlamydomonas incerta TaxID=51695 RepID=A0A835T6C2_CHLIN|nr:hypothetical protein HXX76_007552 [Chlamydomonas incerta]|eukprot:KAG2434659.1 hypothetical protein HXX76_007552 [Chlamydomonas incerta]
MGLPEVLAALQTKPAKRESSELQTLAAYFRRQPFFAGVDFITLQQICSIITLQRASPGEVLLHAGELTDRMYLLLSGRCTIVRHSKKEGYTVPPPQTLRRGQALAEAALVLSGRRSDVAAVVEAAPASAAAAGGGTSSSSTTTNSSSNGGEGAAFAVITRTAWSNMCARAPMQPICGAARTALLNCCARSLAAVEPERRTMEQADDLGAVLRQLPGMAGTPAPVLRALSEAAALRRLPAGTILYEEHTRAESQFVVLSGAVQVRCRLQKLGQSRAAIRSAMRSVMLRRNQSSMRRRAVASEAAAARAAAEVDDEAAAARGGRSVREKIQEERREREATLESVKLTRDGLRDPEPKPVAHGEKSKKFMMEFVSRAKQTLNANDATPIFSTPSAVAPDALSEGPTTIAPPASGEPLAPTTPTGSLAPSAPSTAPTSRAASAWHRAALKLTNSGEEGSQGGAGQGGPQLMGRGAGDGDDYDESDPMLLEYERRKAEEAGLVSDVGNLLGGAGARSAHLRGIAAARSKKAHFYDHSDEEREEDKEDKHGGHVRWADDGAADGGGKGGADSDAAAGVLEDDGDGPSVSRVKLVFMDKNFRVASKSVRFVDAVEKLMRLVRERGDGAAAALGDVADGDGGGGEPTILHDADPSIDVDPAAPLLDAASAGGGKGRGRSGRAPGLVAGADEGSADDEADEEDADAADDDADEDAVEEEHLEQLYGPVSGRVEPGALAGELPPAALCRAAGAGTAASSGVVGPTPVPARHRRANTAIAAAAGADVLVIALEALRRGAEAVRSDMVAERLAVLGALEPLRGLSEEHQAAVALGAAVMCVDSNTVVVRQGQLVDALYVVLDGEVRLLDDPDDMVGTALASGGAGGASALPGPGAVGSNAAWGRTISLDSAALSKAAKKGAADAAGGGGGGGGEGGHGAIKARRAAAALSTLSLLGPGGSFGESVLGYPADLARQAEEQAAAKANEWTEDGEDAEDSPRARGGFAMGHAASFNRHSVFASAGAAAAGAAGGGGSDGGANGGGGAAAAAAGGGRSSDANAPPPSCYLASAVATKPSRLLVLSRQLLGRYGYLRAALPPFAEARRDAVNGRRGQIKGSPANLVASGLSAAASVPVPQGGAAASTSSAGGAGAVPPLQQSPSLPAPRPPPPRPVEFLEQMGFKSLSNPRTAALLTTGGSGGGAAGPSPDRRGALVSSSCRGFESLGASGGGGGGGGGSGLTFSAPTPPNLPSPSSNVSSPSGPGVQASAATAPGSAGGGTPPTGGSGSGLVGSRALGTPPGTSSFGSGGGGGMRSRMLSSGGAAPSSGGGAAGLYGGGGGGLGSLFGVLRTASGQLGQVAEDAALAEPGADGGPGRGVLPAAMQQAARYEQMTGGELDMLTTKPGEESWQAVGAAAAGGRAPPKPRIARTSMTGGGSPGVGGSARSLGLSGTSSKRMSVSGLSTYGNSSFGAVPVGASGGGAMPSLSASGVPPGGAGAGADGPTTRTSTSGAGFLHRLESRGRGGDWGARPALLTVESFGEGSAGGSGGGAAGSNAGSPRATGPSPGVAGGPAGAAAPSPIPSPGVAGGSAGAAAPSPIPSHLGVGGRQGSNSTPLPYINTGGGGGSNPNSGNASALARLALAGAAGGGSGGGGAGGAASRGSGSGTSTPTAAGAGLYGYGMGGSPASGGGAAAGMRPLRSSYTGSPISVSVSPAYGAVTPASPAGFSSVAGGSVFAALAATMDAPPPPPQQPQGIVAGGPVPTGWFTSNGGGGSGGGGGGAAGPPAVAPPIRSTSRKTFGTTGGTAGAAAAAAALGAAGPGSVAGWQQPPPVAAGLLPSSALTSQQPGVNSAPGASRQFGAAAMRVSWDGSSLRGAAAAQRQQQQQRPGVGVDVAATAALLTNRAQQPVAMLGAIGGGGGGGGGSGGGWM